MFFASLLTLVPRYTSKLLGDWVVVVGFDARNLRFFHVKWSDMGFFFWEGRMGIDVFLRGLKA